MLPALFLDRDGVLNVDTRYAHKTDELELTPGATEALALAVDAGMRLVVVTNQGGIALNYYSEEDMHAFNRELARRLAEASNNHVQIAAFYHCPHHPRSEHTELAGDCDCRKPAPGMIRQAALDFPDIDLSRSWMIGDKPSDIDAARNAGLAGAVQVAGNYGIHPEPDHTCQTLREAVTYVVKQLDQKK
jgi:D-glycero-D-manno-heptose 1,7-bisphosphate phosphatase